MAENKTKQLDEIRKGYGWDGEENIEKWSKKMLAQKRQDRYPRNLPVWREIKERFPDHFSWEITGDKMRFPNYPTVGGKNPTLFDLLIIPQEMVDGYDAHEIGARRTLKIGEGEKDFWSVRVVNYPKTLSRRVISQAIELLARWQKVFPQEQTFVQNEFTVPTLLARLDCVVDEEGNLSVYEIEERPAGVGIVSSINEQFRELLGRLKKMWPPFSVVISSLRNHRGDDYLWLEKASLEESLASQKLVLVRAEPEEREFHQLVPYSVSTLATKGEKSYGVHLGLWKEINGENEIPWEEGFCLKPIRGSKMRDVQIWHPRGPGGALMEDILAVIRKNKEMYIQPLIPPMRWDIDGRMCDGIYRIFFGLDPESRDWIPLGGAWNARPAPCFRIHGTPDTIEGPVLL